MKFIFPPRPKGKITPSQLPSYEATGNWVVQRKFNGQRNLIHIFQRDAYIIGRYGKEHLRYVLPAFLKKQLLSLNWNPDWEYWVDSELLDSKTTNPNYKNSLVLFDILQANKYLFLGPNLLERYDMLKELCRNPVDLEPHNQIALRVTDNIMLAETFDKNFSERFEEKLHLDEIEGVVLKKKQSQIDNLGRAYYEVGWQIRCRKPTKNYNF